MNHHKQNSRKQLERKFDRKGVRQLSQVVTEEMTAMQAELQALKMMVEAMIRVLDIDAAVVRQMRRDAKAKGEEQDDPTAGVGEIGEPVPSLWQHIKALFRRKRPGLYSQAAAVAAVEEMEVPPYDRPEAEAAQGAALDALTEEHAN